MSKIVSPIFTFLVYRQCIRRRLRLKYFRDGVSTFAAVKAAAEAEARVVILLTVQNHAYV
jgi:hypothetical protein